MRIGVLALQGSFREHLASLSRLGVPSLAVKLPAQLDGLAGLILPGGESTALGRLMEREGLMDRIRDLAGAGLPVFGTCAGLVLLAAEIEHSTQPRLGLIDMTVRRNGFGRQIASFETELDLPVLGPESFHGVFIRAPQIRRVGEGVGVLARLAEGGVAAVRRENLLAAAFHPELTSDLRMHRYFLDMAREFARMAPLDQALLPASSR
jgi:5'-phosphate synthase pdxT subunit